MPCCCQRYYRYSDSLPLSYATRATPARYYQYTRHELRRQTYFLTRYHGMKYSRRSRPVVSVGRIVLPWNFLFLRQNSFFLSIAVMACSRRLFLSLAVPLFYVRALCPWIQSLASKSRPSVKRRHIFHTVSLMKEEKCQEMFKDLQTVSKEEIKSLRPTGTSVKERLWRRTKD